MSRFLLHRNAADTAWLTRGFFTNTTGGGEEPPPPPPPGQTATFTPTTIARSTDPITVRNHDTGQFSWLEGALPDGDLTEDSRLGGEGMQVYDRFHMNEIITGGTPSNPTINWSKIDTIIAMAQARKVRASFRVMSEFFGRNQAPAFLDDASHGQTVNGTFWMNHNHVDFLTTVQKFWEKVGAQYPNENSLKGSWFDYGFAGNWGEWHTFDVYAPSSYRLTDANQQLVSDFMHAGMGGLGVRGVAMKGNPEYSAGITYQFQTHKAGLRTDSAGQGGTSELWTGSDQWFKWFRDAGGLTRYREAIVEFEPGGDGWNSTLVDQTDYLGASGNYNGNQVNWLGDASETTRRNWYVEAVKRSGYRYELREVSLPSTITRNVAFSLTSKWGNVNKAPTYDDWDITWQLRTDTTTVVHSMVSSYDLRTLMDYGQATHVQGFTVPLSVAANTYNLYVKIPHGTQPTYFPAMSLANTGRTADGAYLLGSVTVA